MKGKTKLKIAGITLLTVGILGGTGTFAWTSMSQRALNEGTYTRQPGGRVHDDYEGFGALGPQGGTVNKDIYAENYSNKPLYVRIKLTEYLELGIGAGSYEVVAPDNTMTPTAENQATVLANAGLENATMADRSSWPAYLPDGLLSDGSSSAIRNYVEWQLGDTNTERKVYLPTFNQNNDNVESDTTGAGIETITWTTNSNYDTNQKNLTGKHDQWTVGETHTSTLRSYDATNDIEVGTAGVTHTALPTVTPEQAGYLTMAEWGLTQPTGNFWVHDNDGWCYWATPLEANSATSLLLDHFDIKLPAADLYYAIHVIGEFVTADNLDEWTDVTTEAKELLDIIK